MKPYEEEIEARCARWNGRHVGEVGPVTLSRIRNDLRAVAAVAVEATLREQLATSRRVRRHDLDPRGWPIEKITLALVVAPMIAVWVASMGAIALAMGAVCLEQLQEIGRVLCG